MSKNLVSMNLKLHFPILILAGLFYGSCLHAQQKPALGGGIECYETGSLQGAFCSAYLSASLHKSTLTFGPCLQKRSMEVKGAKLSFSYLIGDKERFVTPDSTVINPTAPIRIKLRVYSFTQYVNKLPLSCAAAKVEAITNEERPFDWHEARLSSIATGAGIEVDAQMKHFMFRAYFGGSVYHYCTYIPGMYHARTATSLNAGIGISIPEF